MRCGLCVHLDPVAVMRRGRQPDPVDAGLAAGRGGADRVAMHLREVRGAVRDRDVQLMRSLAHTEFALEIAPGTDMLGVALDVQPDRVTLVSELPEGPEGGLDVVQYRESVHKAVRLLRDAGIRVGVFVDPDLDQVRGAHKVDAEFVEFHAGRYAAADSFSQRSEQLARLRNGAKAARKAGMEAGAGRGLTVRNVLPVARIAEVSWVGVGQGVWSAALFSGVDAAVSRWVDLLREARIDLLKS